VVPEKRYRLIGRAREDMKNRVISEFMSSRSETRRENGYREKGELGVVLSVFYQKNEPTVVGDGSDVVTVNRYLEQPALREIRRRLDQIVPGRPHEGLDTVFSRMDVIVYDGLPIAGPVPNVDGLYLAAGQRRERDLTTPALGNLAARSVLRHDIADVEKNLSPERFPQSAPGGRKRVTD
jgi:sarcosine oxidase subunit beta